MARVAEPDVALDMMIGVQGVASSRWWGVAHIWSALARIGRGWSRILTAGRVLLRPGALLPQCTLELEPKISTDYGADVIDEGDAGDHLAC